MSTAVIEYTALHSCWKF